MGQPASADSPLIVARGLRDADAPSSSLSLRQRHEADDGTRVNLV